MEIRLKEQDQAEQETAVPPTTSNEKSVEDEKLRIPRRIYPQRERRTAKWRYENLLPYLRRKCSNPYSYIAESRDVPNDPTSFCEAVNSDESTQWLQACESEIKALIENETWQLMKRPNGKTVISSIGLLK